MTTETSYKNEEIKAVGGLHITAVKSFAAFADQKGNIDKPGMLNFLMETPSLEKLSLLETTLDNADVKYIDSCRVVIDTVLFQARKKCGIDLDGYFWMAEKISSAYVDKLQENNSASYRQMDWLRQTIREMTQTYDLAPHTSWSTPIP